MSYYKTMHLLVSEDDSGLILIRNFHNIHFTETIFNSVKSTKNALEFLREASADQPIVRIPKKWLLEDPSCRVGTLTSVSAEDQLLYIHKKRLPNESSNPSCRDSGTSLSRKVPEGHPVALAILRKLRQERN